MKKRTCISVSLISIILMATLVFGTLASATISKPLDRDFAVTERSLVSPLYYEKERPATIGAPNEKIEMELKDKLDKMGDDEEIAIGIWVSGDKGPVTAFLKAKNAKIKYQSTFAPLIFAVVNKPLIQALASRNDVSYMTLDREYSLCSTTASQTVSVPSSGGMTGRLQKEVVRSHSRP